MSTTANEHKRQRSNALARSGVTQIPDDCHHWITRIGHLNAEQERRADEAIAVAKEQLRAICDRERGPGPVETPVYPLRVFCITR